MTDGSSHSPDGGAGSAGFTPDPLLGKTIGNYQVTQKLGEGGMGSVYLAEHPKIGKRVALKVLHAEFANNQDVVSRFFNEARAVNDIGHPNIVDIVDYGVVPNGPRGDTLVYFIMEFLGGRTLTDLLKAESPMPPERAFAISIQIADALAASHRCGVVHRDLKPDNIMVMQRGREADFVKLLDFGIAKLTGDQPGSRKTRTGIVMGTPWYMSPEQCDGRGFIDHRTDVYALGVVLYEMCAGRLPFQGEGYGEVLVQHLTQPPPAPSTFRGMSPYVEQVILKALEKRPDLRYPTMDEFMRALLDPVAYVESHGGLTMFPQAVLLSQGAMPPTTRLTPSPLTPLPGSLISLGSSPAMASVGAVPTTLGGAAGQVPSRGARSGPPIPLIIGGVVLAAGAAVAAMMLTRSSKSDGHRPDPQIAAGQGSSGASTGGVTTTPLTSPADAAPATSLTPDARPRTPIDAPAAVTSASITIESVPPGALVKVDGMSYGPAPVMLPNQPRAKRLQITLEAKGYESKSTTVIVADDQTVKLELVKKKRGGGGGGGDDGGGDDGGLMDPT